MGKESTGYCTWIAGVCAKGMVSVSSDSCTAPLPQLCLPGPSGPGDTRMLGSEALHLRGREEEVFRCLPSHQFL